MERVYMRKKTIWIIISVICLGQLLFGVESPSLAAEIPPDAGVAGVIEQQIQAQVMGALQSQRAQVQSNGLLDYAVDDVRLSADGGWATAWILYYDVTLDAYLPTEPGLALSYRDGAAWQIVLPGDAAWEQTLSALPEDLLSADEKDMWLAMNIGEQITAAPVTGYNLPWRGGVTGYLSRSVSHDEDYDTAHYSFDFFFLGTTVCPTSVQSMGTTGLNFDIYAAKAGTVWGWDDSVVDCDHEDVNYLVIRNTDGSGLFQLYLHLAQGSIPDALKVVGAPVAQGQFIARADNTGASTGSHLHFQVEGQPYWPSDGPYWATARDVIFEEVNIYAGHPRREWESDSEYCAADGTALCESGRLTYLSANYPSGDSTPPTGGVTGVSTGFLLNSQVLTVGGWGSDAGSGVASLQLMALYQDTWHELGPENSTSFTYSWDVCNPAMPIPDGPVSVAINVVDAAGNVTSLAGMRHFTKDFACPLPPPACIPDADQVTLFEDADYAGGCVKFGLGNYADGDALSPLGNDDAASILVGGNVMATLYTDANYAGHSESLIAGDNSLMDNLVPANHLSSLRVAARSTLPSAPLPVTPASGAQFKQADLVTISWRNGGGALEYQVQLTTPTTTLTYPWQSDPYLFLPALGQGSYTWKVRARNLAGESTWGAATSFQVGVPLATPAPITAPYSDSLDTSTALWAATGLWSNKAGTGVDGTPAWWYQDAETDYATGAANYGWLTSPPIQIPATGTYYLRFAYRYATETQGTVWDQRWVQIAVNGQDFEGFYQLSEDPQIAETTSWLTSPALSLSAFSGNTIQVRFAFNTLDATLNAYQGWGIDNFSVTTTPPAACTDLRADDTFAQATPLSYDSVLEVTGEICPAGDWDFFSFSGLAGERVVVDIDAMDDGSLLDPYVLLYARDGTSILAVSDDEVYSVRRDSLLGFTLPQDGTYYLKVRAWKHPAVGGQDYYYTIRLYEDHAPPPLVIDWPTTGTALPDTIFAVAPQIQEASPSMHRVEFYWHNPDWELGFWELVATDWDGSDGWSASFDPSGQAEVQGYAIFVKAFDRAGNTTSRAFYDLIIDHTPPTSAMNPLSASQSSNLFRLSWYGSDNLSGIATYELQQNLNGAGWLSYLSVDALYHSQWVLGLPTYSYQYRLRAVDRSGNTELYPDVAEASTTIPAATTLCSAPDAYDSGKNDNTPTLANPIDVAGTLQTHNFCNPLAADRQNDQDWVSFPVRPGVIYRIQAMPTAVQTAVSLSLVAQDGITSLAASAPDSYGIGTSLVWTSDRDATIYLRMAHIDGRVIGNVVAYTIRVWEGFELFLPLIENR